MMVAGVCLPAIAPAPGSPAPQPKVTPSVDVTSQIRASIAPRIAMLDDLHVTIGPRRHGEFLTRAPRPPVSFPGRFHDSKCAVGISEGGPRSGQVTGQRNRVIDDWFQVLVARFSGGSAL